MLDCTPANLYLEIESAIRHRKAVTDASMDRNRRTVGPDYRTDWPELPDEHENHGFEFCANFVPQMAYTSPGFDLTSDVLDPEAPQVEAMSQGLNWWSQRSSLGRTLTRIAWDVAHDFGVAIVTLDALPGYGSDPDGTAVPLWPVTRRVSPRRFFMDSQCEDVDTARLIGHLWIRDVDDLMNAANPDGTPAFDHEVLANIPTEDGIEELRKEMGEAGMARHATRKQILGYEVYAPETGMLYTLAKTPSGTSTGADGTGVFLRPPRKYFGPRRGPYVLFGVYPVIDQAYPSSPLSTSEGLMRELNAHAGQASDDAGSAKRGIVVGGKKIAEIVKSGDNGGVVVVEGWDGTLGKFEIDGAQPANLEHISRLQERLDRRSGLSQTIRGNITGATATEVKETSQSADVRTRFAQSEFKACVVRVAEISAQLMHESDQVRFPMMVKDPFTGQKMPKVFIGGQHEGEPYIPFETLRIQIKPYSMEYVDEAILQRRMQTAATLVLETVPAMVANPAIKGQDLLNDLFETLNIKDGADRYIDFGMLAQMQGIAQQNAQMEAMGGAQGAAGGAGGNAAGGGGAGATANPAPSGDGGMGANSDVHEQAAMMAEAA